MKKYLIICISLIFTGHVQCQNEYGFLEGQVIKKDGDTIKCYVQMSPSYGNEIKYKIKPNYSEIKLNVSLIKFLITPYNKFENVTYNNREKLMTIISNGTVTLYSYICFDDGTIIHRDIKGETTTYDQTITYVIKKENIFYEVRRGNFKELLSTKLSDCSIIISKINGKKYKFKDLEKVIKEYNSCN